MKKTMYVTILCAVILLFVLFSILFWQRGSTGTVKEPSAQQEQTRQPLYVVRVSDGLLTVYPYGSNTPVEITDIRVSSLRSYDRKLMEQGFPLYSEEDLNAFLEDFGS